MNIKILFDRARPADGWPPLIGEGGGSLQANATIIFGLAKTSEALAARLPKTAVKGTRIAKAIDMPLANLQSIIQTVRQVRLSCERTARINVLHILTIGQKEGKKMNTLMAKAYSRRGAAVRRALTIIAAAAVLRTGTASQ